MLVDFYICKYIYMDTCFNMGYTLFDCLVKAVHYCSVIVLIRSCELLFIKNTKLCTVCDFKHFCLLVTNFTYIHGATLDPLSF